MRKQDSAPAYAVRRTLSGGSSDAVSRCAAAPELTLGRMAAVAAAEAAAGRQLRMHRVPVFAAATRATALVLQHAPAVVAAAARVPRTLWRARRVLLACLLAACAGVLVLRARAG